MSEFKLKSVTSLPAKPGDKVEAEVEGIEGAKVLLVNAAGKVQALAAKCTHYGAPLVKGVLTSKGRLVCPWHGACFNATTGDVEDAPALDNLPVFAVKEKDGAVYITGDEETIKGGRRKPNIRCQADSDTDNTKVVIVGGGSGTIGAVEGLREYGFKGSITVIGSEGYLPIDRPQLSKQLVTDAAKLAVRDDAWYKSGDIEFVQDEVVSVDFGARTLTTEQGKKHTYSKLILATGGSPKNLPLPGFDKLQNIFKLRRVDHAQQIVKAIGEKNKKIVVVGSSFIGMEVAKATSKGNTVTVVGMEKVPLEKVLGEKIGAALQKGMEGHGVKFYMSASIEKATPSQSDSSKVGAVVLKDGTSIEADLVILGVGVEPATSFLKDNKDVQLEKDGSLKTGDDFAVKGLKDVYAIGDIATYPFHGPGGEGKPVRIEHWNVAQNSGRAVASHLTKRSDKPAPFLPVFWSALSSQLRYCGNTQANGYDDLIVQGSLDELKFVAFYCKGDTVVAVATMNKDPVMIHAAELMRLNKMPSKEKLRDGFDILSLGAPE